MMNKVYEGIMGLIVGDALGVPFEFRERGTFKATGMTGYGTYNQPPGTWSDDSSMTLATLESMTRRGKIDPDDIMMNFRKWWLMGKFTPWGEVFDVGNTTRKAIWRFHNEGTSPTLCGGDKITDNGNGSLMRILPLAFIPCDVTDIYRVSSLTHRHQISLKACEMYISIADHLLAGYGIRDAIREYIKYFRFPGEFSRILILDMLRENEILSTGYVVDTLEAALWCLINTDNYADCILKAVNLGGDTDTIAAVAGGLAGIMYGIGGEKGIPEDWVAQIVSKDVIKMLCDNFSKVFGVTEYE